MMKKDEQLREAGQPGVPGRGSGCVPMTRRAYETMIAGHGALRDTDVRRRSVSFSVEKFKCGFEMIWGFQLRGACECRFCQTGV